MTRDEIVRRSRDEEGGMYIVIPSVVKLDAELPLSAQMLYGVITWKCNKRAYTWATNRELGEALGLSAKRASALLSLLEQRGHVETEIEYKDGTNEVLHRYIYPIMKSARGLLQADPPLENGDTPPQECGYPSPFTGGPPPENEEVICNIKKELKNNTPCSPPGQPEAGGVRPALPAPALSRQRRPTETVVRRSRMTSQGQSQADAPVEDGAPPDKPTVQAKTRRKRAKKSVPAHAPERFEQFWTVYPGGGSRLKAVEEWDALAPSDELIDEMALALKNQMASRLWREGIGIPHAFRWLRDRRWTDKLQEPPRPRSTGGWADGPGKLGPPQSRSLALWGEEEPRNE